MTASVGTSGPQKAQSSWLGTPSPRVLCKQKPWGCTVARVTCFGRRPRLGRPTWAFPVGSVPAPSAGVPPGKVKSQVVDKVRCSPQERDGYSVLGRKLCGQEQPSVTWERVGRHGGGLRDTGTATTEQAATLQGVALREGCQICRPGTVLARGVGSEPRVPVGTRISSRSGEVGPGSAADPLGALG